MSADRFDDLARRLARPLSRRTALKILAAGVAAAVFPSLTDAPILSRDASDAGRPLR
jgi:hypothetical protein